MPVLITYTVDVVPEYKDEWIQVLDIDRQTSLDTTDNVIGFFVVMENESNSHVFNVCIFTTNETAFEKHCETTHYLFRDFIQTNKITKFTKVLDKPPDNSYLDEET
jgi:hypothetical protein